MSSKEQLAKARDLITSLPALKTCLYLAFKLPGALLTFSFKSTQFTKMEPI